MDPQQEVFTAIREALIEKGYDVYDAGLPPDGTPYPFVHLGENELDDDIKKNAVLGEVIQHIGVWHDDLTQRGTLSSMMLEIKRTCREISATRNFKWLVSGINQTVLYDNTTSSTLLHGEISVTFRFS